MARAEIIKEPRKPSGTLRRIAAAVGRLLISLAIPVVTFIIMWRVFVFLRDGDAPRLLMAVVAVIWGVGGVAALYLIANWLVEQLSDNWRSMLQPFVFVGPAIVMVVYFLAFPTVRTLIYSLYDRDGSAIVGLQNYFTVFTERFMLLAFRNNLLWIIFGASLSVVLGLLIATLADRSSFESLAKALIFMPMAISLVGAGVIWKFVYALQPIGSPQIGLLNAIWVAFGGQPQAWTSQLQPWNNLFLIVIVVWLQTGFAMVLFSAALKGIPADLMEAARVDGANELTIFFRIMLPYISGTIITVSTTIVIFTLKIFDVVLVMTGGQYGTEVIATQFYRQYFTNRNFGLGSAIAIVLLIAVIPVMVYNLRQFRKQEAFR